MQYPSKDLYDENMTWQEFSTLLAGIMPETPLGQIVRIRSEENKDVLKMFTPGQKKIRSQWRAKIRENYQNNMSEKEKAAQTEQLKNIFSQAFGSKNSNAFFMNKKVR